MKRRRCRSFHGSINAYSQMLVDDQGSNEEEKEWTDAADKNLEKSENANDFLAEVGQSECEVLRLYSQEPENNCFTINTESVAVQLKELGDTIPIAQKKLLHSTCCSFRALTRFHPIFHDVS
ncbi:hypothetical protein STEG23_006821 [Scotinomys teguina]